MIVKKTWSIQRLSAPKMCLAALLLAPLVKRVVLTSSVVAICGDNVDVHATKEGKFTEDYWNTSSSLTHNPYPFSKTEAEKAAWSIQKSQKQWNLVVIKPSLVIITQ